MMDRETLYVFALEYFEKATALSKAKNLDYARADDPFQNFSLHGEKGFITRMSDKMVRLSNVLDREHRNSILEEAGMESKKHGVNESIEDTLLDLFNYCWLLAAYRANKAGWPHDQVSDTTHSETLNFPPELEGQGFDGGAGWRPECNCGSAGCPGPKAHGQVHGEGGSGTWVQCGNPDCIECYKR